MPFGRILWAGIPVILVVGAIAAVTYGKTHKETIIRVIETPLEADEVRVRIKQPPPPPPPPLMGSFISLTGMGHNETASEGFTLKRPMAVRVYALGEGMGGQMYDYGLILDAETRETVWAMELDATQHAGGADKNRQVDQVITLDAGSYLVRYVSDGSHSWSDWNSARPHHAEAWGITLLSADGKPVGDAVGPYAPSADPAIVALLTGIGDDESRSHRFSLEEETKIRVYAIGEGTSGEMHDYAWIENVETRRAVWEMTYNTSEHAGGGDKNRLFNGTIVLPAGEYVLRYRSDGSHSLEDWNVTPPADPANYGVTLKKVEG
jgi:hypothetical protein